MTNPAIELTTTNRKAVQELARATTAAEACRCFATIGGRLDSETKATQQTNVVRAAKKAKVAIGVVDWPEEEYRTLLYKFVESADEESTASAISSQLHRRRKLNTDIEMTNRRPVKRSIPTRLAYSCATFAAVFLVVAFTGFKLAGVPIPVLMPEFFAELKLKQHQQNCIHAEQWYHHSAHVQLSESDYVATKTAAQFGHDLITSEQIITTGRHYWEVQLKSSPHGTMVGVVRPNLNPIGFYADQRAKGAGWFMGAGDGALYGNSKWADNPTGSFTQGDRCGVLLDLQTGSLQFFKNGEMYGGGFPAGSVSGPVVKGVQLGYEGAAELLTLCKHMPSAT
jgi:hypothetical protein